MTEWGKDCGNNQKAPFSTVHSSVWKNTQELRHGYKLLWALLLPIMFIINFVDTNPQECTEEWHCAGEKTNSCLPNPWEKYTQITHPCENNASGASRSAELLVKNKLRSQCKMQIQEGHIMHSVRQTPQTKSHLKNRCETQRTLSCVLSS